VVSRFQNLSIWLCLALFLAVNIFLPKDGGGNPASRLASLAAFAETHSFAIDDYITEPRSWTADWARSPNGHSYSNKAPGPTLLCLPFYLVWDAMLVRHTPNRADRDALRYKYFETSGYILSLLVQVLPMLLVLLWAIRLLVKQGTSLKALGFFLLACLFGNTAAILSNVFFSHALVAALVLGALLGFQTKKDALCGFFCAMAVLCDYSAVYFLVLIIIAIVFETGAKGLKQIGHRAWHFGLGALLPAAAWIYYHQSCFGSPLAIALKFQNPVFQNKPTGAASLWGVIDILPNADIAWRLLKGSSRGLLMTTPWFLVGIALLLWNRLASKSLVALSLLFFTALFWMNASFGGWDGGATPGPRYLSAAIMPVAFCLAYYFDGFSNRIQKLLYLCLAPSLILYALAFSTTVLAPVTPLWAFYAQALWTSGLNHALIFAAILALLLSLLTIYAQATEIRARTRHNANPTT
jgi:hypothetical protein